MFKVIFITFNSILFSQKSLAMVENEKKTRFSAWLHSFAYFQPSRIALNVYED